MAEPKIKEMTADEFYAWCATQDQRFELVDGFPVPLRGMAGASLRHDRIVSNVIGELYGQLRQTSCWATTPDTAVRTAIKRIRRPDVTVECAPPDANAYEARNPIAVFEILSPTTNKIDRHIKLLIDPDAIDVLVYTRDAAGEWQDERYRSPESALPVAGMARLTLADIYGGMPLAALAPAKTDP
jgi:Uma2 family endonuclease